jgi:hypothetical protein
MVRDTLIVIVLAVVTICILHVLLTRVLLKMAPPFAEGFQSGRNRRRRRPRILPTSGYGLPRTQSPCSRSGSPWITALAHSGNSGGGGGGSVSDDDASPTSHPQNFDSLEDELKQWMRRESGNWAENATGHKAGLLPAVTGAPATDPHPTPRNDGSGSMSTSIDQVFQEQQVDLNGVYLATHVVEGSRSDTNEMPTEKTGGVGYSNVMNSGNLGNNLSAFDGLNSSYATF